MIVARLSSIIASVFEVTSDNWALKCFEIALYIPITLDKSRLATFGNG